MTLAVLLKRSDNFKKKFDLDCCEALADISE